MSKFRFRFPGFLVLASVSSVPAVAGEGDLDRRFHQESAPFVGLAMGRGVDVNLPNLAGKLGSGDLPWDDSRFIGLYAGREGPTLGQASSLLEATWFRNLRQGFTGSVLKHSGLQQNWEAGLAYTLTTSGLRLGPVETSFKLGAGFSHAFSRPSYEDGPINEPDRRYRSQFLLLLENHWRLADSDRWSLVFRVHHRSGIYGLVAPPNVGSNFLAMGVERRL